MTAALMGRAHSRSGTADTARPAPLPPSAPGDMQPDAGGAAP